MLTALSSLRQCVVSSLLLVPSMIRDAIGRVRLASLPSVGWQPLCDGPSAANAGFRGLKMQRLSLSLRLRLRQSLPIGVRPVHTVSQSRSDSSYLAL